LRSPSDHFPLHTNLPARLRDHEQVWKQMGDSPRTLVGSLFSVFVLFLHLPPHPHFTRAAWISIQRLTYWWTQCPCGSSSLFRTPVGLMGGRGSWKEARCMCVWVRWRASFSYVIPPPFLPLPSTQGISIICGGKRAKERLHQGYRQSGK